MCRFVDIHSDRLQFFEEEPVMKKLVALMVALTMVLGLAAVASAADYPTKGLIAINPWSAGGGTDNCLRAFCSALEKQLGVSVTVDNQTGASGVTGHEAIADADPAATPSA